MSVDPNTPVLLGAGQATEHLDDQFVGLTPQQLGARACQAALADTGAQETLATLVDRLACVRLFVDSVPEAMASVIAPFGRSTSPPLSIIQQLGLPNASAIYSRSCGDEPQRLVFELGNAIRDGEIRAAVICGTEAIATSRHLQRMGQTVSWDEDPVGHMDDRGAVMDLLFDTELNRHGAFAPVDIYPLQEQARRGELGMDKPAYREQLAGLMSRFAEVAARNPYAMFEAPTTLEAIRDESQKNRMISDPHLKSMVAKDGVNQAAALVMTRYETAASLGVADRAIFLHGHATGSEPAVLNRPSLAQAESMTAAYHGALRNAGIGAEQLGAMDLYSCFPIAVWCAMDALGISLDDPRPLTLTGGLSFFGGPGNNYSTHGIAEMVHWLRAKSEASYGLVGANGGYLSKHAVGIYANVSSPFPERVSEPDFPTSVDTIEKPTGLGRIESYTVQQKGGTTRAIVVGRQLSDDRRWVGVADPTDDALLSWFRDGDPMGAHVTVSAEDRNIVRRLTDA